MNEELNSPNTVEKILTDARKSIKQGNFKEAYQNIKLGLEKDASSIDLYKMAVTCLRQLGNEKEAHLFSAALENFQDAQPFSDLCRYFLSQSGMPFRLAISFLKRTLFLDPERIDIATELASAYNYYFQPCKAVEILSQLNLKQHFLSCKGQCETCIEFHWSKLLCNQTEGVQEFIDQSRNVLFRSSKDEATLTALDKLDDILDRLEAFPNPEPLVQNWHFIQYGAAILDYCDKDDDSLSIAGGRWVSLHGTFKSIATIIWRLKRFLTEMDWFPEKVVGLRDDIDSEIIGRATAKILNLPFELTASESLAQAGILIVAANNWLLTDPSLKIVQENQTVFALNLHWLQHSGYTPDVAGLMTQFYHLPWKQDEYDPITKKALQASPDSRLATEIATELTKTSPEEDPHFDQIMEFYRDRADYLKVRHKGARRVRFLRDSPVPGAYYNF
ncbi:MAG: type IV pilus biogenesis/stability protein PilW [Promethearchaeota archaeon]